MAKKNTLGDQKSEIVDRNFLEENPEGLPDELTGIVGMKKIPEYKKVQFLNGRDPGVALHFHYASATHPLKHYTLFHGLEHDLPVEIIDHLETCSEPQYGWKKDPEGHPEPYISGRKYIFSFRKMKKVA